MRYDKNALNEKFISMAHRLPGCLAPPSSSPPLLSCSSFVPEIKSYIAKQLQSSFGQQFYLSYADQQHFSIS